MARTRSKTVRRRRYRGGEGEGILGRIGTAIGNLNPFKKSEPAAEAAAEPAPAPAPAAESGDGVPEKMGGRKSRKSRRTRRRPSRR